MLQYDLLCVLSIIAGYFNEVNAILQVTKVDCRCAACLSFLGHNLSAGDIHYTDIYLSSHG